MRKTVHISHRTYHLTYPMEAFAVELKRLFEQYFILFGPFVGEWCKIGQIHDGTF